MRSARAAAVMLGVAIGCAAGACAGAKPEPAAPVASSNDAATPPQGVVTSSPLDGALRTCVASDDDPRGCVEECDRGLASSCAEAAVRFERGRGGAKDATRAAHFYQRACDGRDAQACMALGNMHNTGDGVPRDAARYLQLHERACELGFAAACWIPAKRATGDRKRALLERGCGGGDERCCEVLEADGGG